MIKIHQTELELDYICVVDLAICHDNPKEAKRKLELSIETDKESMCKKLWNHIVKCK